MKHLFLSQVFEFLQNLGTLVTLVYTSILLWEKVQPFFHSLWNRLIRKKI